MQEHLCKIPPAPPTSVIIEEITESPVDLGVPAQKKGQAMPATEGFTPLVLALLEVRIISRIYPEGNFCRPRHSKFQFSSSAKAYLRNLWGSWPKSFRSCSIHPSHHWFEDVLPSTKPANLRRCGYLHAKPFPYKDSNRVPWK